jgi:hypothetical protein
VQTNPFARRNRLRLVTASLGAAAALGGGTPRLVGGGRLLRDDRGGIGVDDLGRPVPCPHSSARDH